MKPDDTDTKPPGDAAQAFLDKVSPLGTPLNAHDSAHYRKLLLRQGAGVGMGDAWREPPNHRFAPLARKENADPDAPPPQPLQPPPAD
jgi:hypothetical protein